VFERFLRNRRWKKILRMLFHEKQGTGAGWGLMFMDKSDLDLGDAEFLIRAAGEAKGRGDTKERDVAGSLLCAVRDIPAIRGESGLVAQLVALNQVLTPKAKSAALQVLCSIGTPEAAASFADLVAADPDGISSENYVPTFPASTGPAGARRLFPRLFDVIDHEFFGPLALLNFLEFRQKGIVGAEIATPYESTILARLASSLSQVRAGQSSTGLGWKYNSPYTKHSSRAGMLLDLLGWLSGKRFMKALLEAGDLLDPKLRLFRGISLARMGETVDRDEWDWIARSRPVRPQLLESLGEIMRPDLIPELCLDQEKIAEGVLANWLTHGNEWDREPDEIERIYVETRPGPYAHPGGQTLPDGPYTYWFFKFRVTEEHWARERGWNVGMAGGFPKNRFPTVISDGRTFSKFHRVEEKSLKEHVTEYLA